MLLFLVSFLVISLAVLAMALGVILGRRPVISGCQSLKLGGAGGCEVCRERGTRPSDVPAASGPEPEHL